MATGDARRARNGRPMPPRLQSRTPSRRRVHEGGARRRSLTGGLDMTLLRSRGGHVSARSRGPRVPNSLRLDLLREASRGRKKWGDLRVANRDRPWKTVFSRGRHQPIAAGMQPALRGDDRELYPSPVLTPEAAHPSRMARPERDSEPCRKARGGRARGDAQSLRSLPQSRLCRSGTPRAADSVCRSSRGLPRRWSKPKGAGAELVTGNRGGRAPRPPGAPRPVQLPARESPPRPYPTPLHPASNRTIARIWQGTICSTSPLSAAPATRSTLC